MSCNVQLLIKRMVIPMPHTLKRRAMKEQSSLKCSWEIIHVQSANQFAVAHIFFGLSK